MVAKSPVVHQSKAQGTGDTVLSAGQPSGMRMQMLEGRREGESRNLFCSGFQLQPIKAFKAFLKVNIAGGFAALAPAHAANAVAVLLLMKKL